MRRKAPPLLEAFVSEPIVNGAGLPVVGGPDGNQQLVTGSEFNVTGLRDGDGATGHAALSGFPNCSCNPSCDPAGEIHILQASSISLGGPNCGGRPARAVAQSESDSVTARGRAARAAALSQSIMFSKLFSVLPPYLDYDDIGSSLLR
jgi:hypothetical protein